MATFLILSSLKLEPPSSVDFHGMLIFYDGQRITIVLGTKAFVFLLSPDANISI